MIPLLLATLGAAAAAAAWIGSALFGKKLQLQGKHCIVTGGSAGIGYALAEELVRRKAHVTLVARTQSKLDEAKEKLCKLAQSTGSGSKIDVKAADVTNYAQVCAQSGTKV